MRSAVVFGLLVAGLLGIVEDPALAQVRRPPPPARNRPVPHPPAIPPRPPLAERQQAAIAAIAAVSAVAVLNRPGSQVLLAHELANRTLPKDIAGSASGRDIAVAREAADLLTGQHPALRLMRLDDGGNLWIGRSIPLAPEVNPLLAARYFSRRIAPGGVRAVSFLDESGGSVAHNALRAAMGDRFATYRRGRSLDELMRFPSAEPRDGARIVMVVGHIEGGYIVTRRYDRDGRPQEVLGRHSLASLEAAAARAGVYLLVAGCKAGERGMTGPTVNIFASQEPVRWGRLLMEGGTLGAFFGVLARSGDFSVGNSGAPAAEQLQMLLTGVSEQMAVIRDAVGSAPPVRAGQPSPSSSPPPGASDSETSFWHAVPAIVIVLFFGTVLMGTLFDHQEKPLPPRRVLDQQTRARVDAMLKPRMANLSIGELLGLRSAMEKDGAVIARIATEAGMPYGVVEDYVQRVIGEELRRRTATPDAVPASMAETDPSPAAAMPDPETRERVLAILKARMASLPMKELGEMEATFDKAGPAIEKMSRSYGVPREFVRMYLRQTLNEELRMRLAVRHG